MGIKPAACVMLSMSLQTGSLITVLRHDIFQIITQRGMSLKRHQSMKMESLQITIDRKRQVGGYVPKMPAVLTDLRLN